MESVLDLYEEPYDRDKPVVCFDERPCQLIIGDVIEPLLAPKPGQVARGTTHITTGAAPATF
jgi:hypothetical protein